MKTNLRRTIILTLLFLLLTGCDSGVAPLAGQWEATGFDFMLYFDINEKGDTITSLSVSYAETCATPGGWGTAVALSTIPVKDGKFELKTAAYELTGKFTAPDRVIGTWYIPPHTTDKFGACVENKGEWNGEWVNN
jgi:hypothetical protein